jgi:hypothetical protein
MGVGLMAKSVVRFGTIAQLVGAGDARAERTVIGRAAHFAELRNGLHELPGELSQG